MFFLEHIWLIPLFPAFGAAFACSSSDAKLSKSAVNGICVGMVALAFLWTCCAVLQYTGYSAARAVRADPSKRFCTRGSAPATLP